MRTTVIPAQITTVEDTIAGNLTLTQILLLLAPVLVSTAIYAVLPQKLTFTAYKIPLVIAVSLVSILFALRIKGRLVLNWLIILAGYLFRPHLFVFNKNTLFTRDFVIPSVRKKNTTSTAKVSVPKKDEATTTDFDYPSLVRETDVQLRVTHKGLLIVKNYD